MAKIRDRVSKKLWQRLTLLVDAEQKQRLESLLLVSAGNDTASLIN